MTSDHDDIQELLAAVSAGDREARKKLFAVLYRDLHALAHEAMRKERADHVLQTTALVHETYMRLIKGKEIQWRSRADFFSMAARAMRYILVDEARSRRAAKRGKGQPPLPLYEVGEAGGQASAAPEPAGDLEQLDEAGGPCRAGTADHHRGAPLLRGDDARGNGRDPRRVRGNGQEGLGADARVASPGDQESGQRELTSSQGLRP